MKKYFSKILRACLISIWFTIFPFGFEKNDVAGFFLILFLSLFGCFCLGIMDELTIPLNKKSYAECLKDAQNITQKYIEDYGATFVHIDDLDVMIADSLYEKFG